jgi:uncharacterized protein
MRLVVDTNVLVSALLKPGSVPDRALSAIWRSALVLYDRRVLDEYRDVLARPKFHGIGRARIDELVECVLSRGLDVGDVTRWEGSMTDEDDRAFVEVALAGGAVAIVTGNGRDYPLGLGFEVLAPATLLSRLGSATQLR